jgi:hypothetical protein
MTLRMIDVMVRRERVDKIVGSLREGQRYRVPTVRGEWLATHGIADWPVVGLRHKDPELGVNVSHYHIDHRFVPESEFKRDDNTLVNESYDAPVRYRVWTCLQACVVISNVTTANGFDIRRSYIGKKCGGSCETGWICPHRGVWLGSQPPVRGVITCPGHGLRINAKTGCVV